MAAGVSVLSDLPHSMTRARIEISTDMDTANERVPTAKYTKMGETLRHVIPGHMQCSMACGGKACKYENPSRWSDEEQAVKGLYSSWITDNLLAMARPSTEIIEKYNIMEQFKRCGLKTVINLQRPGEHASCGNPLEQESGFTYRPEAFMEAGICPMTEEFQAHRGYFLLPLPKQFYYYNFGWKDYGVASLTTILDMVKVMSFAVQEGKMAVHCHAGLGRTGVLLACYLVFTSRMSADQAILFIRAKRPNSIQTRGQLLCVREFAQFLVPLRNVFSCAEPRAGAVTLSQYLTRQRHLLHGYEARQMKHVPKVVQLVCRLLLDIAANRQAVMEDGWLEIPDLTAEVEKTVSQQALQQLGKEMRGKGIPVPPCLSDPLGPLGRQATPSLGHPLISDNDLDPLWQQQLVESPQRTSLSDVRILSFSDSALHKLGAQQKHMERLNGPFSSHLQLSFSQGSLTSHKPPTLCTLPPQDFISRVADPNSQARGDHWSPFSKKLPHKGPQSFSLDLTEQGKMLQCHVTLPDLRGNNEEERLDVMQGPCITLQSELAPESRRLLVAKALAMHVTDKELGSKVAQWQTELNSREGAWERLCMEADPQVLSGLLWSWLEQLKDPVISCEDIKSLSGRTVSVQNALDSLEKGHRLTLLCILDCAAHLLPMPEEVETSFLNQTIRVFTRIDPPSEKNESLYTTLKAILTPILHELHHKAVELNEV